MGYLNLRSGIEGEDGGVGFPTAVNFSDYEAEVWIPIPDAGPMG